MPEDDDEIDPEIADLLEEETHRGKRRKKKDPATRKENAQLKAAYRQALREIKTEGDFRALLHSLGWQDGSLRTEDFVRTWRKTRKQS